MDMKKYIRTIPDYPKKGIVFRDITPLLQMPTAFEDVIQRMYTRWVDQTDAVVALDARGFIFGAPLALQLNVPFVPVRKKGKLPYKTHELSYGLEYGTDVVEMHVDALEKGSRALVVDDLLATGGTAHAAGELVKRTGATLAGYAFVIELSSLQGRKKLHSVPLQSLITYD